MTDEEMAEKYADTVKCEWESETYWVDCRDEVEEAFLAGLKASRPKWHKVSDRDLPKEQKEYWCKVFFYDSEETFNAFLWFDTNTEYFKFLEDTESHFNVKAWCEIPEFEE